MGSATLELWLHPRFINLAPRQSQTCKPTKHQWWNTTRTHNQQGFPDLDLSNMVNHNKCHSNLSESNHSPLVIKIPGNRPLWLVQAPCLLVQSQCFLVKSAGFLVQSCSIPVWKLLFGWSNHVKPNFTLIQCGCLWGVESSRTHTIHTHTLLCCLKTQKQNYVCCFDHFFVI
jgi:hypothetical protein